MLWWFCLGRAASRGRCSLQLQLAHTFHTFTHCVYANTWPDGIPNSRFSRQAAMHWYTINHSKIFKQAVQVPSSSSACLTDGKRSTPS